jgi:hypothetical protein
MQPSNLLRSTETSLAILSLAALLNARLLRPARTL